MVHGSLREKLAQYTFKEALKPEEAAQPDKPRPEYFTRTHDIDRDVMVILEQMHDFIRGLEL